MARLILTNNKDKFISARERNIIAGFDDYAQNDKGNTFLSVHKKRIKKIENYYEQPNGDFCCIVGTCIYRETVGINALKKIYDEFNGDVEKIRENALGNYIIVIKKNKEMK